MPDQWTQGFAVSTGDELRDADTSLPSARIEAVKAAIADLIDSGELPEGVHSVSVSSNSAAGGVHQLTVVVTTAPAPETPDDSA